MAGRFFPDFVPAQEGPVIDRPEPFGQFFQFVDRTGKPRGPKVVQGVVGTVPFLVESGHQLGEFPVFLLILSEAREMQDEIPVQEIHESHGVKLR